MFTRRRRLCTKLRLGTKTRGIYNISVRIFVYRTTRNVTTRVYGKGRYNAATFNGHYDNGSRAYFTKGKGNRGRVVKDRLPNTSVRRNTIVMARNNLTSNLRPLYGFKTKRSTTTCNVRLGTTTTISRLCSALCNLLQGRLSNFISVPRGINQIELSQHFLQLGRVRTREYLGVKVAARARLLTGTSSEGQ